MDISWIQTILGIVLGWQLPNILNFFKFWFYLHWKHHFLEGTWNCYHYSMENHGVVFRHETWEIKRSSFGGLKITTFDKDRPDLIYKAIVKYEKGYLLLDFNGEKHSEEWQARLNELIPSSNSQMRGIMVALDFDRHPYSTPLVVTEKEIELDEAKNLVKGIAEFDTQSYSIRMVDKIANG